MVEAKCLGIEIVELSAGIISLLTEQEAPSPSGPR
jgi:phosphosulfolactate synthase (CoM biosynthesis protein A)